MPKVVVELIWKGDRRQVPQQPGAQMTQKKAVDTRKCRCRTFCTSVVRVKTKESVETVTARKGPRRCGLSSVCPLNGIPEQKKIGEGNETGRTDFGGSPLVLVVP